MDKILRITCVAILAIVAGVLARSVVPAYEESAVLLSFNPETDASSRYMFQFAMQGAHVSPGIKDEMIFGEFLIGAVYKDTVTDSLHGLNRHTIHFYDYNVRELQSPFGRDRSDPRFGGNPWVIPEEGGEEDGGNNPPNDGEDNPPNDGGGGNNPPNDGGGGGGGGGGNLQPRGASISDGGDTVIASGNVGPALPGANGGSFVSNLGLPATGGGAPMQGGDAPPGGGGGGDTRDPEDDGGGLAGKMPTSVNLDTILVTDLNYVTNKQGEVLDVGGLDMLRKVSKNRLVAEGDDLYKSYIDINISHVFEWSHMLYLPNYPVYKEDIWFHSLPIHVPGLPTDQPILTKFMYHLIDLRRLGSRKIAVIDMTGVAEWNTEWDDRTSESLTEFKSWGKMGFSARYWFDYERGMIFGIERPPFRDNQYNRTYGAMVRNWDDGVFQMRYPGLTILLEMFYNTRVTDISNKPKLQKEEPLESRRYINLQMFSQLEAE